MVVIEKKDGIRLRVLDEAKDYYITEVEAQPGSGPFLSDKANCEVVPDTPDCPGPDWHNIMDEVTCGISADHKTGELLMHKGSLIAALPSGYRFKRVLMVSRDTTTVKEGFAIEQMRVDA